MMGGLVPITRTGFDAERYLLTAGVTPADLAAVCRRLVAQGPPMGGSSEPGYLPILFDL
jgi:hypothetical protein